MEVYDTRRRRDGLADIFENVDVSVLMKRLDLMKKSRTPCSSCLGVCEDLTTRCLAQTRDKAACASPVICSVMDNSPASNISSLDTQRVCEEVGRPFHQNNKQQHAVSACSALVDNSSHSQGKESVDSVDRYLESSSLRADFQQGSSSGICSKSTCTVSAAEEKTGAVSAGTEVVDNCHLVRGLGPEVCAKRSLIF